MMGAEWAWLWRWVWPRCTTSCWEMITVSLASNNIMDAVVVKRNTEQN